MSDEVGVYVRRNGEWVRDGEMSRERLEELRPVIDRYNAERDAVRGIVADWSPNAWRDMPDCSLTIDDITAAMNRKP